MIKNKLMKKLCQIFAFIFLAGTGAIIINLVYRYGPTLGFWAGFLCGIIFLIIMCAVMVSYKTDNSARNVNKFFMDLRTKQRHNKILKQNTA